MMQSNSHLVSSLSQLVASRVAKSPDAIILAVPGQRSLTYRRLACHLEKMTRALAALGIGRHDCVALALPPGPELAVAFLAVASQGICAPLPHARRVERVASDLKVLKAKALIVPSGADLPAVSAAQSCGIPVLKLGAIRGAEAGLCTLTGVRRFNPVALTQAKADDVALILRSAGVATGEGCQSEVLTHAELCERGHDLATTLELSGKQRPLNLMSLPFIDQFIEGFLAALVVGGRIACCTQGEASQHYTWLAQCAPNWAEAQLAGDVRRLAV